MKRILSLVLPMTIAVAACAPSSENISAQYVSPLTYQSHNCNQIRMEIQRVSRRVNEVAEVQDDHAGKDSAALGVGLVLFWPALFFMIGEDKKEELARLKGEYEALEQVAIQKECNIVKEIEAAEEMRKERLQKKEIERKPEGGLND